MNVHFSSSFFSITTTHSFPLQLFCKNVSRDSRLELVIWLLSQLSFNHLIVIFILVLLILGMKVTWTLYLSFPRTVNQLLMAYQVVFLLPFLGHASRSSSRVKKKTKNIKPSWNSNWNYIIPCYSSMLLKWSLRKRGFTQYSCFPFLLKKWSTKKVKWRVPAAKSERFLSAMLPCKWYSLIH